MDRFAIKTAVLHQNLKNCEVNDFFLLLKSTKINSFLCGKKCAVTKIKILISDQLQFVIVINFYSGNISVL